MLNKEKRENYEKILNIVSLRVISNWMNKNWTSCCILEEKF